MDFSRTPRKLLTAFVEHNRPTGRPCMTFGQTLTKTLKDYEAWLAVAQDRHRWRLFTTKLIFKQPF
jgi:hypothetical protein